MANKQCSNNVTRETMTLKIKKKLDGDIDQELSKNWKLTTSLAIHLSFLFRK